MFKVLPIYGDDYYYVELPVNDWLVEIPLPESDDE